MINKSQKEIMATWKSAEMTVSITCVAFNHEQYIEETLDSFLMQETNFPFEILINDDVSNDRTVEILKSYEEEFPDIVKPVYQTENQYSQGINTMAILFPYVTGKYVAYCDGDDYWIDKEKLQIQVDAMNEHPELDLCFHTTYEVINDEQTKVRGDYPDEITVFPAEKSILGHFGYIDTSAMMFTASMIKSLPEWFITASPGDYMSEVMGADRGGSLFINRTMSIYRTDTAEGWTAIELRKPTSERRASMEHFVAQLKVLNETLNLKYDDLFSQVIKNQYMSFITSVNNTNNIKQEVYSSHLESFSIIDKLKWHLLFKHQALIEFLKSIKTKLNKQVIT